MRRPRFQKVFADLWSNRVRSLLVVASIAVGLFALGVMATIYLVALDDMQRGYASANPAHITFHTSLFEQGLVERIASMPGVNAIQGQRTLGTRLQTPSGEWVSIDIQAVRDPQNQVINRVRPVEGVWSPGEREIVIDRYKFPELETDLGDWITLELPSGGTQQFKLVGVVQDQTVGAFRGSGGFFNAPIQGYVTQDSIELLEQPLPKRFNMLFITLEGDGENRAEVEKVAAAVRDELERNLLTVISVRMSTSYEHPNLHLARAILAVLVVIGLLVVFLSGFLITNTLQALLNQQVQQIGILKSVGGKRSQIIGIYMSLNLLYGILAFIVALPLSFQTAFWIINYLTTLMNNSFYGARIVPEVVFLEAAIAVLMPQIAAIIPVWQGTRISVQEALSGLRQDHPPDQGWLDKRLSQLRNYSMLIVISLRNTFRRKWRLLLTVITLTLGGAVFIATFNVRISLLNYIDQIVSYFLADVNITLDRDYRIEEIESLIKELPDVKYVEGWAYARSELIMSDGSAGESVDLLAPPAESPLVEPILVAGRWIKAGDRNAIALSELFRDQFPDLKVGDAIRLRVNGKESDWVIVGFYQLAGKVSGFAAYTSYEYLAELTHRNGRAMGYRVVSYQVDLPNEAQEALGRAVEAHLNQNGIEVIDVTTGKSLSKTASEGFNVLTAFLLFLALLTALVGSIGLTGTMSLNVMERTREIGVLRAIGASDATLMKIVLMEGALIGVISWMLASMAAFPISSVMADAISQSLFGGDASFGITFTGFAIWLGIVIVLSVLASVMPARSATHLTIREVLSYE
ncbi:MAG: ABC transporter permease [Chloroflexi bacterium]|nr:ABC transporter permease [Chloroflexota bacterium]